MKRRIALIHAVTVAIDPVARAFAAMWPEADCVNILDDSLSVDRARTAEVTPAIHQRIMDLAAYARSTGADGVLFTCSAFGSAIEAAAAAATWPVHKPNQAMFDDALAAGNSIGMIATFERSVPSMQQEFEAAAAARARLSTLRAICVPEAMVALQRGDAEAHNALVAEASSQLKQCDAIMLAQFSTSIAQPAVQARVDCPVLSSPASAVRAMKRALAN